MAGRAGAGKAPPGGEAGPESAGGESKKSGKQDEGPIIDAEVVDEKK